MIQTSTLNDALGFRVRPQPIMRTLVMTVLVLCSISAYSQTSVSGSVKDEEGNPLPGVNVIQKGTSNGTTSDGDGNYAINVSSDAVLIYSFIGYTPQEVVVGSKTLINISLIADVTSLEEIVVTGYYAQRKSDLTGSVGIANTDDLKKVATYDVAKMLQGQVAGVTMQSSGEPGGFVNIKIRGASSFNNNNPQFVVDGILVDGPFDLATNEIESMQVLKDASSAAIYGIRGANGVIVITTKKGSKSGKFSINYNAYYGVQEVPGKISLTDRVGYQNITNAAYVNSGQVILPGNDPTSQYFINNVDTDWQDAAYRTGKIQNHSLSFNGGTDALSYSMNVDYFKNTGYLKTPQAYDRIATSINLTGKQGKFRYGSKIAYTQSDKENFNEYLPGTSSVINLVQAIPTMPVFDANRLGGYGGTDNLTQRAITLNVVGFNNLQDNSSNRNRFIGNIWGELEIIKGLRYTLRASADRLDYGNRHFNPPSDLGWYYITTNEEAALDANNGNGVRTIVDNMLNYDLQIEKHKLEAFVGYVMERNKTYYHWGRGVGYEPGEISHLEYAAESFAGEDESEETRISFLSRLNYSFDDRYILTGTFRQDKSSLFPAQNRNVNSYSVAAAWKIHNDFTFPDFIGEAKLRAGYGTLPTNTISPYEYSAVVNAFAGYTFNNELAPGTTVVGLKDPNIDWEMVTTTNVALEVGLFNDRLQVTTEYYEKIADQLLVRVPLPFSTGSFPASIWTNAGKFRNRGMEYTVRYVNENNAFKYTISGNFSTLTNKVLKIDRGLPIYGANSKTEVGRSIGEIFVYETDGIFQSTEEVQAHAGQSGAVAGDIRFKDNSGDGLITDADRAYQGNAIPKYTYGTNFSGSYKNFDFSFFFQGSAGNKVYNATYNALMIGGLLNHHTDMLNYWSPENRNTNVPRPDVLETNQNARASNRFIEDGDYIKLQNIQIGYSIPLKNQNIIQKARVYASGQNVWTISGYRGYDPDFMNNGLFDRAYDYGSFPNPRTFMLGVQVSF